MSHFLRSKGKMSHFLKKNELYGIRDLGTARAGAVVEHKGGKLVLQPRISVLRQDTRLVPLPERIQVVTSAGQVVNPSSGKRFWVTIDSIDPMHAVTEAADLPILDQP